MTKWPRQLRDLRIVGGISGVTKGPHETSWDDQAVQVGINILFLFSLFLFLSVLFTFRVVPPQVPLHYSRPWGAQQLVGKSALWLVAGLGVLSAAVHVLLAASLFRTERLMAQVSVWAAVVSLLLLILAVLTVYIRVGPL